MEWARKKAMGRKRKKNRFIGQSGLRSEFVRRVQAVTQQAHGKTNRDELYKRCFLYVIRLWGTERFCARLLYLTNCARICVMIGIGVICETGKKNTNVRNGQKGRERGAQQQKESTGNEGIAVDDDDKDKETGKIARKWYYSKRN